MIFGADTLGRLAAEIARSSGWSDIIFYDDNSRIQHGKVDGVPVAGGIQDGYRLIKRHVDFFVAMGRPSLRRAVTEELATRGAQLATLVHSAASVASTASVGPGSLVDAGCVVGPGACLLEGSIFWSGVVVSHDSIVGPWCYVGPGAVLGGGVRLGPGVMVGLGAMIRPGLSIAGGSVIAMGHSVTRSVGGRSILTSDAIRRATADRAENYFFRPERVSR